MENSKIETKFPLGSIVATPGALKALAASGQPGAEFLARHQSGDWGTVGPADAAENQLSVEQGFRILSAYTLKSGYANLDHHRGRPLLDLHSPTGGILNRSRWPRLSSERWVSMTGPLLPQSFTQHVLINPTARTASG